MVTVTDDWLGGIAERLRGKVGFEDDHISVRTLERLRGETPRRGRARGRRAATVEKLRRVKDEAELAAIAAASELADEVWRWSLERGLAGRSERDVARAAEARIRELGAEPSFPAIVAAGPNGALPHAEPGEREIGRGELVVFDMGAKLDGYCSDGTRTFATGEPGERGPRRSTRPCARRRQPRSRRVAAGVEGEDVDARRPRADRRRRPRRSLRPRPRPRRRPRGPRGAAPLAALRGRARAPAKSSRSSRGLPAGRARGADRGPGGRHRGRATATSAACRKLQIVA